MKAVLWTIQVVLALLAFAGGAYKLFAFAELAKMPATSAMSRAGWSAFGVFEMICAVLLIVPAAMKWMPQLTTIAAVALGVESLVLAAIYARFSLSLAATNPLVWAAAMAVMAAFVAYGRHALKAAE